MNREQALLKAETVVRVALARVATIPETDAVQELYDASVIARKLLQPFAEVEEDEDARELPSGLDPSGGANL